jgi:2-polyprenyl-6-methoxyphenol hydroxylase-like FAD-dependent oxidoreductase
MLNATPLARQYENAATDPVRTLVVGAGIAGITVAQLLREEGKHPVLVERSVDEGRPGYMLALMPMVDGAIDDLGLRKQYRDASVPLNWYNFHSSTGRPGRTDSLEKILAQYGDYRGIGRGELMDTLSANGCDTSFDTTVTAVHHRQDGTEVALTSAGTEVTLDFDLVIVADGIHSSTRPLALGDRSVKFVDTGWGGWVVWAPEAERTDLGAELWGAGFFLGAYPVKGKLGVIVGGPNEDTAAGPAAFVEAVRRKLTHVGPLLDSALTAVAEEPKPYYWPLTDCRASVWAVGRTVLLGDAAAGFLPTAGVGAGMAMESAWVLARMLRDSSRAEIPARLQDFENAQRPRVETAQQTSRQLAKLMFRRSRTLAVVRDFAMKFLSVEAALKPIQRLLAERPR